MWSCAISCWTLGLKFDRLCYTTPRSSDRFGQPIRLAIFLRVRRTVAKTKPQSIVCIDGLNFFYNATRGGAFLPQRGFDR